MSTQEPDIVCTICNRQKKATEFFKQKNGTRLPICKDCLTQNINNREPDTFLPILEKFDVPFIEDKWVEMANKKYAENPHRFGPKSVIGTYLRSMNLGQYKQYGYADSDKFNKSKQIAEENAQRQREANLARWQKQVDAGVMTPEEFERLSNLKPQLDVPDPEKEANARLSVAGAAIPTEDDWLKQLTEEEITYLTIKWGSLYKPSEWITMEKLYLDYSDEFELSVDREQALKTICKLQLKIDQALDIDDTQTVLKLTQAQDTLRRSAKFTDAQNKEEKQREIDSLGELVRYVELKKGAIPLFEEPIEYPKDKIDLVIKDLKNYTVQLVRGDLGLGNLIESFIKKLEEKQKADQSVINQNEQFKALEQRQKELDVTLLDQQAHGKED